MAQTEYNDASEVDDVQAGDELFGVRAGALVQYPTAVLLAAAQALVDVVAGNLTTHQALTTGAHGGIVADNDARLTDARNPTAHAATHEDGGVDELTLAQAQITGLVAALADTATAAQGGLADTAVQPADLGTAAALDAGSADGVAELDGTGKVPAAQLPSFVDDVVEAANFAALPGTGEAGKIYVTIDDGKTYRWSGSAYAEISASLALGETSTTAYRGDRGKTAYDHSQLTSGNPHSTTKVDVGLGNVDDTAQVAKATIDAKGDLLVGTADNTVARVAVGANDTVLTADSAQAGGVKWAAPSGTYVTQTEFDEQGPSGRELAVAESTVQQTGITSITDLTGMSITFTVGTRPVWVEVECPVVGLTTVGAAAILTISDGANVSKRSAAIYCAVANETKPVTVKERISTPGEYTRKVRLARSGAGTASNGAGNALYTAHIRAIER